jgi:AraC-like DNA-binding protein
MAHDTAVSRAAVPAPQRAGSGPTRPPPTGDGLVILQLAGESLVIRGGGRMTLREGDLVVVEPSTDGGGRLPGSCLIPAGSRLAAVLRRELLAAAAADRKGAAAAASAPAPVRAAPPLDGGGPPASRPTAAGSIDRAAAGPGLIHRGGHRLARLQANIEASLADPGLRPAAVAARHGMSVRHLHRLFRPTGLSFSAYVRSRRLAAARADLLDPALAMVPVTEIALRWGFSDSAHFSRSFRAAYGCTARSLRAAAAAPAVVRTRRSSDRSCGGSDGSPSPESR